MSENTVPNLPAPGPPAVPPAPPPPNGWIDAKMTAVFGRNWRTQLGGIGTLLGSTAIAVSAALPGTFPAWVIVVAAVVTGGSAGSGLIAAKDGKVSGLPK